MLSTGLTPVVGIAYVAPASNLAYKLVSFLQIEGGVEEMTTVNSPGSEGAENRG